MAYNGLATLFARYEWKEVKTQEDSDNNPFTGNIPEIQITLLGRKVASLTVADPAGEGEWATAPIRYSTNPAEILLDYLRSPTYGKGLINVEIDWDSFKKAAAKCNQQVTYVTGISGPILTCNFVVDTGRLYSITSRLC
jgi:predicted phage tail protein